MIQLIFGTIQRIRTSFVLLLFFLSVYLFTMSGVIQYGDEAEKYLVAQSMVERQDLSFHPTVMRNEVGRDGRTFSIYELGTSLVEVPFYLLGRLLLILFPAPDSNWITQLTVGLMNPVLSALGCLLLFKTSLLVGYGKRTSVVLTLVCGLATIVFPYSKNYNREPLLTVLILALLYTAIAFRQTQNQRWVVANGILAGTLVFTKLIQAAILPVFLLYLYYALRDFLREPADLAVRQRILIRAATAFLVPVGLALAFQMIYAYVRFGTVFGGLGGTRANPLDVIFRLIQSNNPVNMGALLLFSPEKSIFLYSPPIILFLILWFAWLKSKKPEAFLLLGVIIITILSAALRPDGDAGGWWGPRYFVQITPLFLLPIGAGLEMGSLFGRRLWAAALAGLSILGFGVQLVGVFTNSRDHLDILGYGPSLANEIEFLRRGAIDAMFFSPAFLQVNLFGIVLVFIIGLMGARILREFRSSPESSSGSRSTSWIALGLILCIETVVFGFAVVAPYPRVLAAQADTKYAAGNRFLADGNLCVANALHLAAVRSGTDFFAPAAARLNQSLGLDRGNAFAADDLIANVEAEEGDFADSDGQVSLSGERSVRIFAPANRESTITVVSRDLPVRPNTRYRVSGWKRTLNVYGAGGVVVTIYEDDGNWRKTRETEIDSDYQTSGWSPFWGTVTTLPSTQRFILKLALYKTFGTVWIDDVRLTETKSPASVPVELLPPCSLK